jgi:Mg/Co/Ni transporter MgtE
MKDFSYFQTISAKRETTITKLLAVCYGLISVGLAFLCSNLGSLIQIGGIIFGACMGPMFAYTLVSVLLPFVNLKVLIFPATLTC